MAIWRAKEIYRVKKRILNKAWDATEIVGRRLGILEEALGEVFISDATLADGTWGRSFTTRRHKELIDMLEEENVPKSARILDVGCLWGFLAKALHHHGYRNLSGCDRIPTKAALRPGKPFQDFRTLMDYHGIDLNRQGLDPFESDGFDLVICSEVLEHLEAPGKVLKEFQRVLKPGGLVFLEVPNPTNLFERWRFFRTGRLRRYGREVQRDHTGHISFFNEDILGSLCVRADFDIVKRLRSFAVWRKSFLLPRRRNGFLLSYGANYLLKSLRTVPWEDYPYKDFHGSGKVVWTMSDAAPLADACEGKD